MSDDSQFYTTFDNFELTTCTRSSKLTCDFNKGLSPITHETCIMALFANDKDLVHKHCNFRVLLNHLSQQIHEITKSSILVYQSNILELDCKNGKRMVKGCNFCVLFIPCECGITTPQVYLPPRIAACQNKSNAVTKVHPINLALLQQFFNSTELENITGNSMYHNLPDMSMPHFKIYNHTMSKILADDRTKHFSLKKMIENAKKDAVIFQSLTESLLDGKISIEQDWFSTSYIMIYVTMTTTAVCLVALVVMYLKLRKVLVMLSVLQASVGKTNATAVPRFHYKSLVTPEPLRTNPFIDLQLTWDHTIFFISCCTLIILVFWTVYWCVKKRNRVILMLELTSGENCVLSP